MLSFVARFALGGGALYLSDDAIDMRDAFGRMTILNRTRAIEVVKTALWPLAVAAVVSGGPSAGAARFFADEIPFTREKLVALAVALGLSLLIFAETLSAASLVALERAPRTRGA